jgi:hypothetical protein
MGERRGVYRVWVGNLRERDHLGDPCVDGEIIKINLQETGCGDMDRNELVQDTDRWQALVNVAINLQGFIIC